MAFKRQTKTTSPKRGLTLPDGRRLIIKLSPPPGIEKHVVKNPQKTTNTENLPAPHEQVKTSIKFTRDLTQKLGWKVSFFTRTVFLISCPDGPMIRETERTPITRREFLIRAINRCIFGRKAVH